MFVHLQKKENKYFENISGIIEKSVIIVYVLNMIDV